MSNAPKIDDFCDFSYRMGNDFNSLELLMSDLYSRLENGETVTDTKELLKYLSEMGLSMLNTQKDFVEIYGNEDKNIQNQILYQIEGKSQSLSIARSQLDSKIY